MKTIKIAHLYYDLMNLYGETGNIMALKEGFKRQGVKCDVDYLSKGSKIDFSKSEIFYMGMGSEANQEIVRKDILRYREEFRKNIKKKTFIMTGNSFELLVRISMEKNVLEYSISIASVYVTELSVNKLLRLISYQIQLLDFKIGARSRYRRKSPFRDNKRSRR